MNVPILAEEYLSRLAELKQEMDECQIEIRLVYAKLTKYLSEGHLDYLKSSSGSITYKNKQYIPVKGRVIYDYSSDPDIAAKQKELRQLKKVAEAIGTLESKQSPDSWRIKDLEAECLLEKTGNAPNVKVLALLYLKHILTKSTYYVG